MTDEEYRTFMAGVVERHNERMVAFEARMQEQLRKTEAEFAESMDRCMGELLGRSAPPVAAAPTAGTPAAG